MIGRSPNPPAKPTVIYDGKCSFCLTWVKRLQRWDFGEQLVFLPLQDPSSVEISGQPTEELLHALYFVSTEGLVYRAAAAVGQALGFSRWRILVRILAAVPGAMRLAEVVYARVAANRYIFECESEDCSIEHESKK